jgi:hypothetical protein
MSLQPKFRGGPDGVLPDPRGFVDREDLLEAKGRVAEAEDLRARGHVIGEVESCVS